MPRLTCAQARQRVDRFDWSQVEADPNDVQRIRESLQSLVHSERDDAGQEDAFGDLMDAAAYVDRSEQGTTALLALLLDLATCTELFGKPERLVSDVSYALQSFPNRKPDGPITQMLRQNLKTLNLLFDDGSSNMQTEIAILVAVTGLAEWRDRLRARFDSATDQKLRAHLTLALIEMGIDDLEPLGVRLAHQANDDWRLQRAAAICLRLAAHRDPTVLERLPVNLITFADGHGQPGWLKKLYEEVSPLEMPPALQTPSTLTPCCRTRSVRQHRAASSDHVSNRAPAAEDDSRSERPGSVARETTASSRCPRGS